MTEGRRCQRCGRSRVEIAYSDAVKQWLCLRCYEAQYQEPERAT